jgi:histidyl-tRNA synthetase
MNIVSSVRKSGYSAETDFLGRSVKAQMRTASKLCSKYVVFVNSQDNNISVKDMQTSHQNETTLENFLKMLKDDMSLKKQTETLEIYEGY